MKILLIMLLLIANNSFANYETGTFDPDCEVSTTNVSEEDVTSSDPNKQAVESPLIEEDPRYQTDTFTEESDTTSSSF